MSKQISQTVRKQLWEKYNHRCAYCGKQMKFSKMTIDHVIPTAKLPKPNNHITNLMPACSICNNQKAAMTVQEFKEHIIANARKCLRKQENSLKNALCVKTGALRCVEDVNEVVFYFETLPTEFELSKSVSLWQRFQLFFKELMDIYHQSEEWK